MIHACSLLFVFYVCFIPVICCFFKSFLYTPETQHASFDLARSNVVLKESETVLAVKLGRCVSETSCNEKYAALLPRLQDLLKQQVYVLQLSR